MKLEELKKLSETATDARDRGVLYANTQYSYAMLNELPRLISLLDRCHLLLIDLCTVHNDEYLDEIRALIREMEE